jgi:hypothetical protein
MPFRESLLRQAMESSVFRPRGTSSKGTNLPKPTLGINDSVLQYVSAWGYQERNSLALDRLLDSLLVGSPCKCCSDCISLFCVIQLCITCYLLMHILMYVYVQYFFPFFFFEVLGIELRALSLLRRCSTTWTTPSAPHLNIWFRQIECFSLNSHNLTNHREEVLSVEHERRLLGLLPEQF